MKQGTSSYKNEVFKTCTIFREISQMAPGCRIVLTMAPGCRIVLTMALDCKKVHTYQFPHWHYVAKMFPHWHYIAGKFSLFDIMALNGSGIMNCCIDLSFHIFRMLIFVNYEQ